MVGIKKIIDSIYFEAVNDSDKETIASINEQYSFDEKQELSQLEKINLFVGSNNSGKSRLMRQIAKIKRLNFTLSVRDFKLRVAYFKERLVSVVEAIELAKRDFLTMSMMENSPIERIETGDYDSYIHINHIKEIIDDLENEICDVQEGKRLFKKLIELEERFRCLENLTDFRSSARFNEDKVTTETRKKEILTAITAKREEVKKQLEELDIFNGQLVSFKKVYIPILRGLLPISPGEDVYGELIKKRYFDGQDVEVFTGLTLYDDITNMLLGKFEERELIRAFQIFLSEHFFDGQDVLITPIKSEEKIIYIKIGDEEEYPIYDLGDGLQALIILTFPLFKYKHENLLLFIEEPELNLHPGMQRKLMEILYSDVSGATQFFMTTHSNHLLDMTLDSNNISVYTFRKSLDENVSRQKKAKVKVTNVASEKNHSLELLGVRNSALFLTNCTIWIEGITDRLYIRKYLEVYQGSEEGMKKYKEDIHYSFVEYSGNNITHWNFLDEDGMNADNLCGKLFLISDLDGIKKDDSGQWTTIKGRRHEKLAEVLKDRYICLQCREIENSLSPKILTSVICEYEKVASLNESGLEGEIVQEEYAHKLLGEYIEEKLKNKKRRGSYKSDSGTISDKVNFCKKAIDKIKSFDDLSPEAQQLTEKLYQFIEKNNN